MNFTVHADARPADTIPAGVRVLVLTGELDHGSAPRLQQALDEMYTDNCRHLIVDVTGLAFCDSTGISVFLGARRTLSVRDGSIALAGLNPRIERIFRLTGLARAFPTYPTAEDARAAIPTP
ncbi:STAS domain-containing protein [Sphaerisporangium sp. TRM90804]|uniref:STAS domain-containing protein n=1 Tax=Sphaerisporangium sp. TRM90804 TaxID=3031113 RepID=UPI0024490DF6|nr:STAS domain-containing protein [Sphaerisporangium sp. TRM90804]MDH2426159.1 STAS domain-containing protein [Sphaerisporangium sp. TRM90804]